MQRKRPLQRKTRLKSGTTPLPTVNPVRQAKRRQQQRSKHAAYRASETYRVVSARAGGQCEMAVKPMVGQGNAPVRCPETSGLAHHHVTYARYGGAELPEDIAVVCRYHHAQLEAAYPTRKRGRAA